MPTAVLTSSGPMNQNRIIIRACRGSVGVDSQVDWGHVPPTFLNFMGRRALRPPTLLGIEIKIVCHRMPDFKAEIRQIRIRLGLCARPCWGSLTRFPRPLQLDLRGREGRKREINYGEKLNRASIRSPSHFFLRIYPLRGPRANYLRHILHHVQNI